MGRRPVTAFVVAFTLIVLALAASVGLIAVDRLATPKVIRHGGGHWDPSAGLPDMPVAAAWTGDLAGPGSLPVLPLNAEETAP